MKCENGSILRTWRSRSFAHAALGYVRVSRFALVVASQPVRRPHAATDPFSAQRSMRMRALRPGEARGGGDVTAALRPVAITAAHRGRLDKAEPNIPIET